MKKLKNILFFILIAFSAFFAALISIPIMIILAPIAWFREKIFQKKYNEYLISLNGKNFFCYNNRKKGLECIRLEIIPNLPSNVEIIFLNGKKIESELYNPIFLSETFNDFKNYEKFPHLLKIRNGKAFDCSLNAELFSYINNGKSKNFIDDKIEQFFELNKSILVK